MARGPRPASPAAPAAPLDRRGLVAWCLFDWANSAFPTVVLTFVFAAYYTQAVAPDPVAGTASWGYAMSLSALLVAVAAPVLGAIADRAGRRKPWLLAFTAATVAASAALWLVHPDPADALLALVLIGLGNFLFETGGVFYNAMLPDLVPKEMIGRLSGWGWGLGYIGGLACLGVVLVGFVQNDSPWFGVSPGDGGTLRASALVAAVWFAVFAAPLFLFTRDAPASGLGLGEAAVAGLSTLAATLKHIGRQGTILRFLVAAMIYSDGLNTLFAFGGIYAAGSFGMDFGELILFGIAINVTAGAGAALFAWVDDWIGSKPTILIALGALTVLGLVLVMVEGKTLFWVFALPLGIFIGPAQAASRSMMAHLAPPAMRTEMFGLFTLSGKATVFLGPALLALATDVFASQRAGMATILLFFAVGAALLWGVKAGGREG